MGFSGVGWAGEAWRWALKYNYVPHRWNLFFGCHTLQTSFWLPGVTPQWMRRGWVMGLSYYSAWHWGRADWTLGFWLLLSLSLGLGWSNAGWPGHYLRECACLSKSPCSRPSKLFPRRKYVLSGWDFFCLLLGKTSAGNFWVLLSFCLPLLERPDDGLLKHISSQVQSSKTLFWPDLRDFHLAVETPQLPSRGWAIGYGYFSA